VEHKVRTSTFRLFARRKAQVTWSLVVEVGPQQMTVDKEVSGGRVLELRADANGIAMEGIVAGLRAPTTWPS